MKILIVDDSALSRRILTKILMMEDNNLIEANNGLSAIEIFSIEKPEIVFLDLNMPDINGIEVLKNFKEISPDSKIIVATADLQESTKKIVMENGAFSVINKPFNESEILDLVRKIKENY